MSSPQKRFYQANWFWCLVALGVLVIPFAVSFSLFVWHRSVREKMDLAIMRLAVECPRGLSEDQWAYCVTWTWQLHSNYGSHPSYVPTDDLDRIADELDERIDRGANLATINWIWDEYIKAYPRARRYNHYRPTAAENKELFETGAHGGHPLSEWRAKYEDARTRN